MNFTEAIAFAVEKVKTWVNENKQDKITGEKGQIVGFDDNGKPTAQTGGADGVTPVRGKDYWTETDKSEIVSAVLKQLPIYNGEVEDA